MERYSRHYHSRIAIHWTTAALGALTNTYPEHHLASRHPALATNPICRYCCVSFPLHLQTLPTPYSFSAKSLLKIENRAGGLSTKVIPNLFCFIAPIWLGSHTQPTDTASSPSHTTPKTSPPPPCYSRHPSSKPQTSPTAQYTHPCSPP